MKKLWILLLAAAAVFASAAETKNLSYYDEGFPRTGNLEYLQEYCKLDLFLPEGKKDFPTLVWFHGGGLSRGQKHVPRSLRTDKIAVAAVNYRLSGKRAECPDYIYDAAAAAAWVKKHIAEYGGDPEKVYIAGHSAGGYLTMMLALDGRYLGAYKMEPKDFAGYFPVSGQATTHFRILAERKEKGMKVADVMLDEYAPIQLARQGIPPITLLVGDPAVEWPARVEENFLLAGRLKRVYKNERVECLSFPSFTHGSVIVPAIAVINAKILKEMKK